MKKFETVSNILESGVVAVVRAESKEQGFKIIEAVKKGGIKAIEITLTVLVLWISSRNWLKLIKTKM